MDRDTLFQELGQAGAIAQGRINNGENPLVVMMDRAGLRFQDIWRNTQIPVSRLDSATRDFDILTMAELRSITRATGSHICDFLLKPLTGHLSEGVLNLLIDMVESRDTDPADGLEAMKTLEWLVSSINHRLSDKHCPLGQMLAAQMRHGAFVFDAPDRFAGMRLNHARQLVDSCLHEYFGSIHIRFSAIQIGLVMKGVDQDTGCPFQPMDLIQQRFILDFMLEWQDKAKPLLEHAAQAIYITNRVNKGLCQMHLQERDRREGLRMQRLAPSIPKLI